MTISQCRKHNSIYRTCRPAPSTFSATSVARSGHRRALQLRQLWMRRVLGSGSKSGCSIAGSYQRDRPREPLRPNGPVAFTISQSQRRLAFNLLDARNIDDDWVAQPRNCAVSTMVSCASPNCRYRILPFGANVLSRTMKAIFRSRGVARVHPRRSHGNLVHARR